MLWTCANSSQDFSNTLYWDGRDDLCSWQLRFPSGLGWFPMSKSYNLTTSSHSRAQLLPCSLQHSHDLSAQIVWHATKPTSTHLSTYIWKEPQEGSHFSCIAYRQVSNVKCLYQQYTFGFVKQWFFLFSQQFSKGELKFLKQRSNRIEISSSLNH